MMANEPSSALELEIGHVLAIDVVGYSKLLIHEQTDLLLRLNEIVRGTQQFRTAVAGGKLIRLPTGDAMVLVFFGDPKAPIEYATKIAVALTSHRDIQLRMGIHSGPINEVLDVNERTNVAGAGIDIAQHFDLTGSKQDFERAIELDPNSASAHYFLGLLVFAPLGQFDQAIAEFKRAVELDPFSPIVNANLGYCYYLARRYPEAITELRKTLELDPNFNYTHVRLAHALEFNGDLEEVRAEFERIYNLHHSYKTAPVLAHFHGLRGEREKAVEFLRKVESKSKSAPQWAYFYALIYIGFGDKNKAIDYLEQSYRAKETRVIIYIKVDPMLDPLRGDLRFEKLANQIVPPDSEKNL
jgi:Flp pilus assembly protein TadD